MTFFESVCPWFPHLDREFASVCIWLLDGFRHAHFLTPTPSTILSHACATARGKFKNSLSAPHFTYTHEPVRTCQNNWEIHWHRASTNSPTARDKLFFKFYLSACIQYHSTRKSIRKDIFDRSTRFYRDFVWGNRQVNPAAPLQGLPKCNRMSSILWRFCTREQVRCTLHLLD